MKSIQDDLGMVFGLQLESVTAVCENCGECYKDVYVEGYDDPYVLHMQHTSFGGNACVECGHNLFDFKVDYSLVVAKEVEREEE